MSVYLGRHKKHVTATITAVLATVSDLTTRTENLGQKLYGNKFFFSLFIERFTYENNKLLRYCQTKLKSNA
jgi:hypothetical protein